MVPHLRAWIAVLTLLSCVLCTRFVRVDTPILSDYQLASVRAAILGWFPLTPNFQLEQLELSTTLQADIEAALRRSDIYSGLSWRFDPEGLIRFVEIASDDPYSRVFFAPLPSERWLTSGYSARISDLRRRASANLFVLFRSSYHMHQNGNSVARLLAVGAVNNIDRGLFEERFRAITHFDNQDMFWLHHTPAYSAEALQIVATALHIHP